MEIVLIIVGAVLLIINIMMVAKFFQIARNINLLTQLFIDGRKPIFNPDTCEREEYRMLYYNKEGKLITKEEWGEEKKKDLDEEKKKELDESKKYAHRIDVNVLANPYAGLK